MVSGIGTSPIEPPEPPTDAEVIENCIGLIAEATDTTNPSFTPEMIVWLNASTTHPSVVAAMKYFLATNGGCNPANQQLIIDAIQAILDDEVDTLNEYLEKIDCIKLNDLLDPTGANIKPDLEYLKTTLAQVGENGVLFKKDLGINSSVTLPATTTNSIGIPTGANGYGAGHSHPISTYPMFSWSDVYTLLKLYTNAQPTEKRGVTFMLACSPTSASSGEVYAITISDPSAFLVKMNVDLANIRANTPTLNFGTPQSELIEALDDKLGDKYASNNDSEQVFLDYFNDFGISTYKANPVIDNWSKLTIDDSSVLTAGTVIEIPCN